MLKALKDVGIDIYAFADNDTTKQKEGIEGFQCFSKIQLLEFKDKQDLYIIVSPRKSKDLYDELLKFFPRVFSNEICDIILAIVNYRQLMFPIGHYYSLYPDLVEIEKRDEVIFDEDKKICDIDLYEKEQVELWKCMKSMYSTVPKWKSVEEKEATKFRYRYHNRSFPPADAVILNCMLRFLKPKNMIEVGSGWSSAVSLDTNEFYLDNSIDMTFIEPYADNLKKILKSTDNINLIEKGLQDMPCSLFEDLEAGDILFIDTTHVSKVGSDVNYLLFEIMPCLKSGVYIHFHDIFYPFEYPRDWIFSGQIWNELYLLRAFLQNNNEYKIVYFQNMLQKKYASMMNEPWMQLFQDPFDGGSLYIKKL